MDPDVRNELAGTVHGNSMQAGVVNGDVHLHAQSGDGALIAVYAELNQVRQQLVESMRAERVITQVVWVLQNALLHLQQTVARLTWERDRTVEADLVRAKQSEKKTRTQLIRAETEREKAIELLGAARRKLVMLETVVRRTEPVDFTGAELASLQIGLAEIDRFLDRQDALLAGIEAALGQSPQLKGHRTVTVVTIDDHPIILRGAECEWELAGSGIETVASGHTAAVAWSQPGLSADVVVTDLYHPLTGGEDRAGPAYSDIADLVAAGRRVVVYSTLADIEVIRKCVRLGAHSFVYKGEFEELVSAILAAALDVPYWPPVMRNALNGRQ
ncbi:hypothetical protein ABT256_15915 [Amycolatopsis japonica]|uniref:hypothetical protein n=1 Tax=Amycolatopsis japonica TaxID=208439 RepID=UPI0033299808